jgi:hypothetical protein
MKMKITVSEGLRLKNELKNLVNKIHYETKASPLGVNVENGVVTSNEEESGKFKENLNRLEKSLGYSFEINSKLSDYNRKTNIDDKVREMQNVKLLLTVYENALPRTKSSKTTRFETVGNERKQVVVEYKPTLTGTEVKENVSKLKTQFRNLQNEVEKLNSGEIELSFSFEDVENL